MGTPPGMSAEWDLVRWVAREVGAGVGCCRRARVRRREQGPPMLGCRRAAVTGIVSPLPALREGQDRDVGWSWVVWQSFRRSGNQGKLLTMILMEPREV
ncbi:hypothetical protein MLD38_007199 [Melastoma candidum]|uniref:Uncharacterized protein n=1 Tax=Melastoma candidum TaxID=119954 RepID=A0ACB9RQC2_9MYRT|nr:hypothetical protein MLD38_007199 [Melastoma candidum]